MESIFAPQSPNELINWEELSSVQWFSPGTQGIHVSVYVQKATQWELQGSHSSPAFYSLARFHLRKGLCCLIKKKT